VCVCMGGVNIIRSVFRRLYYTAGISIQHARLSVAREQTQSSSSSSVSGTHLATHPPTHPTTHSPRPQPLATRFIPAAGLAQLCTTRRHSPRARQVVGRSHGAIITTTKLLRFCAGWFHRRRS